MYSNKGTIIYYGKQLSLSNNKTQHSGGKPFSAFATKFIDDTILPVILFLLHIGLSPIVPGVISYTNKYVIYSGKS